MVHNSARTVAKDCKHTMFSLILQQGDWTSEIEVIFPMKIACKRRDYNGQFSVIENMKLRQFTAPFDGRTFVHEIHEEIRWFEHSSPFHDACLANNCY
jgi:hypothetical protein